MKPEANINNVSYESIKNSGEPIINRSPEVRGANELPIIANQLEKKVENASMVAEIDTSSMLPIPVITSTNQSNNTNDAVSAIPVVVNPVAAGDEDLIEKEWVDRAKKIVSENKDDPHKMDDEVNKLQADYIKKRYGREIGKAS
jgi:hypothetical protein